MTKKKKIQEVLERSVEKIYPSKQVLQKVLESGKKLTIYHGVDPTGPHLHLGHATNLLVLRRFQDLGHKIIFLIGDFTGRVGDPSDRPTARKRLSEKQVKENLKTFKQQASKVITFSGKNTAKVRLNSRWLGKLTLTDVLELASHVTVQQLIKREMFRRRLQENKDISLHEFLYPLMQGYDSVALGVDMEIGGTDQTFNMLVGRDLMKKLKRKEKFVLTTKLLEHPKTGKKLMSKSEGGLINLDDEPNDMFGKVMALDDEVMFDVAEFCSTMPLAEIKKLKRLNPREAKLTIAFEIVKLYHSLKASEAARDEFVKVFSEGATPGTAPTLSVPKKIGIVDLLMRAGVKSKSEARRLIEQNAVKLDNKVHNSPTEILSLKGGDVLKIGKRRFFRIVTK